MTNKPAKKIKLLLWIGLPVVVLLIAAVAGFFFVYKPVENIYLKTMSEVSSLSYEDADAALSNTVESLDKKPFSDRFVQKLNEKRNSLRTEEIENAIAKDNLGYASTLLEGLQGEQAELYREKITQREEAILQEKENELKEAYRIAGELEKEGKNEEAEQAFLSLGDYQDASERAKALRQLIELEKAKAIFNGNNYDEAVQALKALGTEEADKEAGLLLEKKEQKRIQIRETARNRIAAGAWHTAAAGNESVWIAGDARFTAAPENADAVFSGLTSVFYLKEGKVYPAGENFGAAETIASLTEIVSVAPGITHCVFLKENGRVEGVGSNGFGKLDFEKWNKITDIAAGAWHTVGLQLNGYVEACGNNDRGQCDVSGWETIVDIDAGLWHTVGLRSDGTVIACGDNTYGQCEVSEWKDVVAVSCGACCTVGLKSDGTVIACGDNTAGQCDTSSWTEIAAIDAGAYHTVGVRMDGSLIACGLLPEDLPEDSLIMETGWQCEPITADSSNIGYKAEAYIEGKESKLGPWLYMDNNGAVTIFLDETEERMPFRMDMIATSKALPEGRVTTPEASGNIIRMTTELPEVQARKAGAVVAFTGDYIGYSSNRKAVMIRNGICYYDRDETTTLAIMPEGTLQFYKKETVTADELISQGVKDSFSFGPLLVNNGKQAYTKEGGVITMRVVFGYTDPYHFVTLVTQRDRIKQMSYLMTAEVMMRYGAKVAYNLDGGHSTSLVFMGKELSLMSMEEDKNHSNIRGLSDIIMFLHSEDVKPEE